MQARTLMISKNEASNYGIEEISFISKDQMIITITDRIKTEEITGILDYLLRHSDYSKAEGNKDLLNFEILQKENDSYKFFKHPYRVLIIKGDIQQAIEVFKSHYISDSIYGEAEKIIQSYCSENADKSTSHVFPK